MNVCKISKVYDHWLLFIIQLQFPENKEKGTKRKCGNYSRVCRLAVINKTKYEFSSTGRLTKWTEEQ